MYKKRGQVSIFLLLGILILLFGAFYFFIDTASKTEIDLENPQVAAAKNFIDACIQETADRAFRIIGVNGGYITFPDDINNDPRTYLQHGPVQGVKIPYWWYDGKHAIPTEEFIVGQAEQYITNNLDECIDQLALVRNINLEKVGKLDVQVTLNAEDITVDVKYPLQLAFEVDESRVEFREFKNTIPIRFKKVFEFAKNIMERENQDHFFERRTIDLLTLDEDIPTTDIEATCKQKVWFVRDVENKLKKILQTNLPYVNIVGTEYNPRMFVPNPFGEDTYEDSYFNAHFLWDVTDLTDDKIGAAVTFDENWPMRFAVRPSKNGVMRSNAQKGVDLLEFLCIHIWHFTYDVVYPLKITVTDDTGVDPYIFNFAFKVSVDHNVPKRENLAFQIFEGKEESGEEEYCNDVVNEITLFTVEDSIVQNDIVDANLTFTCGIYTCDIGQTEWLGFGAAAGITKQLPMCNNAIIRAKKEEYKDAQMFIQTEVPGTFTLSMIPLKEFTDFEVVKHDLSDPLLEQPLEESESVSISITSQDNASNHQTFTVYPNEGGLPLKLLRDDQKYTISMFLTNGEDLTGGYESTWTVSRSDLENAARIKFRVLEYDGPDDEIFIFIQNLKTESKNIPTPEIIQK